MFIFISDHSVLKIVLLIKYGKSDHTEILKYNTYIGLIVILNDIKEICTTSAFMRSFMGIENGSTKNVISLNMRHMLVLIDRVELADDSTHVYGKRLTTVSSLGIRT